MNQHPVRHTAKPQKNIILRVLAGLMGVPGVVINVPMSIFAFFSIFQKPSEDFGLNVGVFVLFGLCALVSILCAIYAFKPNKTAAFALDAELERQVLQLANMQHGTLSLGVLAMNSSLSTEQSQLVLDDFVRRGVATATFDDDGLMLYRFAGLSRGPAQVAHQKSSVQSELDAFDRELARTSFEFDSQSDAASEQHAHPSSYKKNS